MAGLSSISGLIAGFDTQGAVDELLGVKKYEISQLQKRQDAEIAKQDAMVAINDLVSTLRNTAISMADETTFFGYTASLGSSSASVPASSLLDVSGTNAVSVGQHSIIVEQLAQAERLSSSAAVKDNTGTAAVSDTTALNLSGSFLIEGVTINVAVDDSLQDIASAINQQNSGATATGVSASVVKVGDNDFRLTLVADETGATGFTLSGADLDAAGALANLQMGGVGQANQRQSVQTAQDAQLSVDGLTVTRSSNTITDVLSGVTLSLKQADPTVTVNMTIGVDQQALRDSVQSFVDAYNGLQALISEQFQFDENTQANGVLAGSTFLTTLQSTLSSSLLQAIPGAASDRSSLVMIGVEPDASGVLSINEDRFSPFLASDPTAIRDLFVAQGSTTNTDLQFLTHGLNTTSGSYSVNVTTAATRAEVTGTTDLTLGLGADQSVTITETGNSRQAVVNLTTGQTQSAILSALNTEFAAIYTEQRHMSTALTAGGFPATGSSTFTDLALGITAGDTISIAGTSRTGAAISGTYTVSDPATDTLSALLAEIQVQFNQKVIASLDASGRVQITDSQSGDSLLSLSLTANNEGLGTLAFGSEAVVTEGRHAMNMEAVVSGNGVKIQSASYGSTSGFSIAQSVDGLGITGGDQTVAGVDVVGTINGLSATGRGQLLTGSEGNVDFMSVLYTGTTPVTSSMSVGIGVAAGFDGLLDLYSNPITGLMQSEVLASQDIYTALVERIATVEAQMERQRVTLTQSFIQMEQAMSSLQLSGSFMTQQIDAQNARR